MAKYLVVVESPAKSKTIAKYLGKDYQVLASYGHVRDLVAKEGAVDTQHDFAMHYEVIERNQRHVDAIQQALKKAETLYLATDPDREGEAIAWHLTELLEARGALKGKEVRRVVFHEITKKAVTEAVEKATSLNQNLVNAQQARRALDYLVGFSLSPLLWKKIRRGLSAGRVQSPALRLIVEREGEIRAFEKQEYWTVEATLNGDGSQFDGKLNTLNGAKLEQFSLTTEAQAEDAVKSVRDSAATGFEVLDTEKKSRRRNPLPPFITSTLQQEASKRLGFTAQRTMRIAQGLYEGIDIGSGPAGLITYMRTDSVSLAEEALTEIREYIGQAYGPKTLPTSPNKYKTKSKNAQEAHEAIRPTSAFNAPLKVKSHLNAEQFKLYQLIWQRAVASQMNPAKLETVSLDIGSPSADHAIRATGTVVTEPGFLQVYDSDAGNKTEPRLPPLKRGDPITLTDIEGLQHFTEPPPRYSEASLIKALEEYGIGRPSTYASIISTLQQREYVELDKKRFIPTDVGEVVGRFLTEHFKNYVDYGFTAHLEDDLDRVADGSGEWIPLLQNFWEPLRELIADKTTSVNRADVTQQAMDEACPECGKPLVTRLGKRGNFVGCSAYPECSYTRNVHSDKDDEQPLEIITDRNCPECNGPLAIRDGKYGKFIGCTNYPDCRHIEPLNKPKDTGVGCPACKKGTLLERKSRRGKVFFSCSEYPGCSYAVWNPPLAEPCPDCSHAVLTLKTTKKFGREKVCPVKECGYKEAMPDDAELPAETDSTN
ncbi:MAG: type I DNA topoisomerase [Gammaproteobacteria bacterium]|nr:type I DNA topoisomerase [Gammaproteobacteria bacterium]